LQCHDVFTNQYCPRGPFCAFAHADHEMNINRNVPSDTNLKDIIQTVLPSPPISAACHQFGAGDGNGMGLLGNSEMKAADSNHSLNSSGSTSLMNSNMGNNSNNNMNDNNGFDMIFGGLGGNSSMNVVGGPLGGGNLNSYGPTDRLQEVFRGTTSPLDHGGGYTPFGTTPTTLNSQAGASFGAQSFASAAASGATSNVVGSGVVNHGGKFFEDQRPMSLGKLDDNGMNVDINNVFNGPMSSNKGGNGTGHFGMDNILGAYQSEVERDGYKLFGGFSKCQQTNITFLYYAR